MFAKLYNKVLKWSEHRFAVRFLMCLSFVEASCFPVPPDVMLGPMTMAKPDKAWRYAFIATLFSVLGGILGYILGLGAYHTIVLPLLSFLGKQQAYNVALSWFQYWGVWVVIIAAFTPIPYKLFTIGAGALQMSFPAFVVASLIGRSMRFFLVCGLFKIGNKYFADWIQRWIDVIGWTALILVVIFYYILLRM